MIKFLSFFLILQLSLSAKELITPIPLHIEYDEQKALLGKKLFQDPILSKDGTISCESCHDLKQGGVDGVRFSVGVEKRVGNINAPTVYNAVFNIAQFWDGRAKDLKEQALGPIHNPIEMGTDIYTVIKKLKQDREYVALFKRTYGGEITRSNISESIAEFEKALITPNSKFDRYLRGESKALNKKELQGYKIFKEHGCISCHNGVNMGGNIFQKFGIFKEYEKHTNKGRYNVTKNEDDMYYFKVPSLRNISETAPYFHDGSAKTLREAILRMSEYQLAQILLDDEIDALVSFLYTLKGEIPDIAK